MSDNLKKPETLADDEIQTLEGSRRSFLRRIGAIGAGTITLAAGWHVASASDPNPRNDRDDGSDGNLPDKKYPYDRD